jgi:hypothetical protein
MGRDAEKEEAAFPGDSGSKIWRGFWVLGLDLSSLLFL